MNSNKLIHPLGVTFFGIIFFFPINSYCMNQNDYCKNEKQLETLKTITDNNRLKLKISYIIKKIAVYGSGQERAFMFKLAGNYNPKKNQTPEEFLKKNKQEISQIIGGKCLTVEIPKKQNRFVYVFDAAKKKSPKSPRACKLIECLCLDPEETPKIVHEIINQPEPDRFR